MSAALLDTHALLWLIDNSPKLSTAARERIREPGIELFFSYASAWEIAIKFGIGKLVLPEAPQTYLFKHLRQNKIRFLPSIFAAGGLPQHHGDPFDRLLIAQCLYANLPIVSHDAKLDAYCVQRVW